MHILVLLLAGLLAVTFAHPSLYITDEWVTVNQLSQLHEGHQILYNEGKYGVYENGTPTNYFIEKQNYLGYPLFLPVISLPAYWLLDLFGDNFIFFILYLWTFLLIAIAFTLNSLFPKYSYIGKWRWTTGFIVVIFIIFFVNLFFYSPFSLIRKEDYPEIMAIAFTNIILFSFLAVMIYDICLTIFENPDYALFGTVTCISSSSYLFWTSFCKDHVLVVFLITAIILLLIKLLYTEKAVYLAAAFSISGLLAWARPDLALAITLSLCILVFYIIVFMKKSFSGAKNRCLIFFAPLFTLLGAVPFFINNYIITKNIFLPAFILWNTKSLTLVSPIEDPVTVQQTSTDTLGSLSHLILMGTNINPSTFLSDLYGVFFNPSSCSMGIIPIIPLFLTALLLLPLLAYLKEIRFTKKERLLIGVLILVSLGVFLAYARGITGLNTSVGITPDMRYMSPLYLPLTLIGIIILRKMSAIADRPLVLIKGIVATWCIFIPLSLIVLSSFSRNAETWSDVFPLLNAVASIGIYLISIMFLIAALYCIIFHKPSTTARIFLILLCAAPLIWQIDVSFLARYLGVGLGGYSFWIPVVLRGYAFIF